MVVSVDIPIKSFIVNPKQAVQNAIAEIELESGMSLRPHVIDDFYMRYNLERAREIAHSKTNKTIALELDGSRLNLK